MTPDEWAKIGKQAKKALRETRILRELLKSALVGDRRAENVQTREAERLLLAVHGQLRQMALVEVRSTLAAKKDKKVAKAVEKAFGSF